ncbi:DUF1906 domain-containing protein [Mesorhizobium sp. C416B]|uniref:DUF1906 domain-containing protein n=1 Tax=unclassified Mesorhizobium TaxID=325217 RepID=UPI0003CDE98A|nr:MULTISPECIES: DUF1906 domain-containing protein [unclassified Mesorhizobium]ESX49427.1 hypothetical protein X762_12240 [Mesorhizobium sp. LSHC426A00]ESX56258.1 hypothetical protein X761_12740 [Mesorhizobium sp. LSHC424B00]ESX73105.1 hypothetical protein X758_12070 [Mesorhizobium sp. LSHC416B00]WJI61920.1 DUF1906 domain-containing protein [Mesorhizobium sp. C416B]
MPSALQQSIVSAMYAVEAKLDAGPSDAEKADLLASANILVGLLARVNEIELAAAADRVAAASAALLAVVNASGQDPVAVYLDKLNKAVGKLRKAAVAAHLDASEAVPRAPAVAATDGKGDAGHSAPVAGSGIDCATDCSKRAIQIAGAGKIFVARYYRSASSKWAPLTAKEAQALSGAGLKIVTVWESDSDHLSHFSHSTGVAEGTSAYKQAMLAGQPSETPIYFAVDFDCDSEGISGPVNDYFRGVKDGFSAISSSHPAYSIGVYGSGNACAWLAGHGRVQYAWLAMSTGWGGSKTFKGWNIKQGKADSRLTFDHDTDEAVADYGGFSI